MLKQLSKSYLFIKKPIYGFARQITLNESDASNDLKNEIPYQTYQNLMVIPTRLPIFPHNSLVTQIHPLLYEHLIIRQTKYLGAFPLKDGVKAVQIEPQKFMDLFKTIEVPKETDQSIAIKEQIHEMLENFHQNILYETSVLSENEEPEPESKIQIVGSTDDIFHTGTICRVSYQKLQERGKEHIYLILKGVQRINYIQKSSPQSQEIPQVKSSLFGRKFESKNPQINKEDNSQSDTPFIVYAQTQPIKESSVNVTQDVNYKIKLSSLLGVYAKLRSKIPINVPELVDNPTSPSTIDTLCGFLCLSPFFTKPELMQLFLTIPLQERMAVCYTFFERYSRELTKEWDTLEAKTTLPVDPQTQKQKMQEIYDVLKRQFATPGSGSFVEGIKAKLNRRTLPSHIQQVLQDELEQISEMQESHPDFNIKRNFVEFLVALPFGIQTHDDYSLTKAQQIFESTHYGMEKVKRRVLEFLAVSKLRGQASGKTLLLQGPPGVGKTSIASTIAECLGRKFVRVSLGGESDVAIIKGHRRTYMASYPGKIIQALKQAQSENPVILIDEIDKLGQSYRGNIADSLLEVLDPVQNSNFIDNYLEVGIDLSKVLFICSANLQDTIPAPLLDRMEVIELSGYTIVEKTQIAERHLVPKIIKDTGLLPYLEGQNPLSEDMIKKIIQYYCRESGVRQLQRTLLRLFEKLVVRVVRAQQMGEVKPDLSIARLDDLIGVPLFDDAEKHPAIPGLGIGLAYNSSGGSIMYIEIVPTSYVPDPSAQEVKDPSKPGSLKITGQLGSTIKESVQIAYTHAKFILHTYYQNHYLEENQLHMHFPAGAIKKDGPSAGIAIASSLVSMALGVPIKSQTAMTGEISLTGKVLRIGGLKEKILAAKREGIQTVLIPVGNRGDYDELTDNVKQGIEIHLVEDFIDVVNIVFDKNLQNKLKQY